MVYVLLFQTIHESFLRTVAPYSDQANVWVGLLKYFRWNTVILLTSNDQDSRMIASKFTGLAEKNSIKVIMIQYHVHVRVKYFPAGERVCL